jgi:homocysteine S-methyltransferase
MEHFLETCKPEIPVLVGILPLRNTKHTEFMHNEVPDITIPDPIRARMAKAGKDGPREGVACARDYLEQVAGMCQGVYLMPPFYRFEMAVEIVQDFTRP